MPAPSGARTARRRGPSCAACAEPRCAPPQLGCRSARPQRVGARCRTADGVAVSRSAGPSLADSVCSCPVSALRLVVARCARPGRSVAYSYRGSDRTERCQCDTSQQPHRQREPGTAKTATPTGDKSDHPDDLVDRWPPGPPISSQVLAAAIARPIFAHRPITMTRVPLHRRCCRGTRSVGARWQPLRGGGQSVGATWSNNGCRQVDAWLCMSAQRSLDHVIAGWSSSPPLLRRGGRERDPRTSVRRTQHRTEAGQRARLGRTRVDWVGFSDDSAGRPGASHNRE